ncbi:testis-expressed protein 47-like isoform X2 [Dendropsophus ebraccatus]|uniref:testis-expressed protein 47-like isoform X2 n=1 Tax=Dendropsophus ebraccatus TaxID=150705 RepID=UPI00383117D4
MGCYGNICSAPNISIVASLVTYRASIMASRKSRSSTPGLPHISALTVLLEAQHMKSIIHRLIYVAQISPEQAHRRDIPDHYDKLFHQLIKSNLGESISGLLLLYPSCVIHMIEATSEILTGIIQDLVQIQKQGANSLLQDVKILVVSHNIPCRLLPKWYFRTVRLPTIYLDDFGQSVETVVEECLTRMMKLGMFLSQILEIFCGHLLSICICSSHCEPISESMLINHLILSNTLLVFLFDISL